MKRIVAVASVKRSLETLINIVKQCGEFDTEASKNDAV